jgi:hypothetical protein
MFQLSRASLLVLLGIQVLLIVSLLTLGRQRELQLALQVEKSRVELQTAQADFAKCNRRVISLEQQSGSGNLAAKSAANSGNKNNGSSTADVASLRAALKAERAASVERERSMLDQLDAATVSLQQCRDSLTVKTTELERVTALLSNNGPPGAASSRLASHLVDSQAEFDKLRSELAQCKLLVGPTTTTPTLMTTTTTAAATTTAVAPALSCDSTEVHQLHVVINNMRDELSSCKETGRDLAAQLSVSRKSGASKDCPQDSLLKSYPTVAPVRALAPGITLAMHLDKGRLASIVKEIAPRWPGPIVLSIFAQDQGEVDWIEGTMKWIEGTERIRYSVFMYHDAMNVSSYPVNVMRNHALQQVRTELVVLLDGDFVPDASLYARFSPMNPTYAASLEATNDGQVLVVPCFFQMNRFAPVPANKTALFNDTTVGGPSDPRGRPHHGVTDYAKWRTATSDYLVDYQFFYEPYFVQATRHTPFWDERFVYYGFDKVVYMYVLDRLGFRFKVLADHFVVHKPHPRDPWYEASGKKASDDAELHELVDRVLREWGDTENADWRTRGQEVA